MTMEQAGWLCFGLELAVVALIGTVVSILLLREVRRESWLIRDECSKVRNAVEELERRLGTPGTDPDRVCKRKTMWDQ